MPRAFLSAFVACAVCTACSHDKRLVAAVEPRRAHIETFSEPSAVMGLQPLGGELVVGTTAGLERWNLRTGTRTRLGAGAGVRGRSVRAVAPVPGSASEAWVVTDAALLRYDVQAGKAVAVPPPIAQHAAALKGARRVIADPAGGVWIAGSAGLFHADFNGVWQPAGLPGPITALYADRIGGGLWVGTPMGLQQRNVGGVFTRYGEPKGLAVVDVAQLLEGPAGELVVIGETALHEQALAFYDASSDTFATFRLAPATRILRAAHRPDQLVLATPEKLIVLGAESTGASALHRNGVHLVWVAGTPRRSPYRLGSIAVAPPPQITDMAAMGNEVFIGTRAVGTARVELRAGARPRQRWIRLHELVAGAISLTVACRTRTECYIATGSETAWRWDGRTFTPLTVADAKPGSLFLAVVRSPRNEIVILYREVSERVLHLARLEKGVFRPEAGVHIETPSGTAGLSFAKFAPDGNLWLGLQYVDQEDDTRPYGVAIADLSLNVVTYHHETVRDDSARTGVLPVPNDVVDVAFLDDEIWFASLSGAARIKGEKVTVWSEADELRSEILHGIVATEGGVVYVASTNGVGEFDGRHWTYPPVLNIVVNALARGADGKLWMATDRGLVVFDGKATARIDRRSGLLDEGIKDIAVDHFGRIWARSDAALSIVAP